MGERFLQSRVTVCVVFKNKVFSFPSKNLTSVVDEAKFVLFIKKTVVPSTSEFNLVLSPLSSFSCLCGIKRIGVLNEWHDGLSQLYAPPPLNSFSISLAFPETIHYVAPNNIRGGGGEVFHAS